MEIGVWGDSITYGECDSQALGWVGRLRKSLLMDRDASVYNFGVCGDTTEDLLKRFKVEADSIQPDKIVVAIGINDTKYPAGETTNKVPFEKFKQNMRKLVAEARNYTDKIYVVGATKVDDGFARMSGTRFVNADIQTYNSFLQELDSSEKLPYIDVFDTLDPTTDLEDGLHPNAQGYEKLFAVIGAELN